MFCVGCTWTLFQMTKTRLLLGYFEFLFRLKPDSFAQWRYSNQWSNREVLLLLVENYTQYPAISTWNTVVLGNFCRLFLEQFGDILSFKFQAIKAWFTSTRGVYQYWAGSWRFCLLYVHTRNCNKKFWVWLAVGQIPTSHSLARSHYWLTRWLLAAWFPTWPFPPLLSQPAPLWVPREVHVKQHWVVSVLGWVTAWEYTMLYAF